MNASSTLSLRTSPFAPAARPVRVLYSFPYRIGAQRICSTAWHHADAIARAGATVTVLAGSFAKPFSESIRTRATLAIGRFRLPHRFFGTARIAHLHDLACARWLNRNASRIDVVHTWPLAARRTIEVARLHAIPVVLERPNAHTRFAYETVAAESRKLGVELTRGSEHVFDARRLAIEEAEYAAADFLLCPSDFVARTFVDAGYSMDRLLRHQYGYNADQFHARGRKASSSASGLVVLHAGIGTPRKGLHYALEAWLGSGAHHAGTFLVCGTLSSSYRERISSLLSHPSVKVLGQRSDLADIMRQADVFTLPTIEEGSALVTYEARACGCVLAVSDASGAVCEHMNNALVHPARDVAALTAHFQLLDQNRSELERLRWSSLSTVHMLTWETAGKKLVEAYRAAIAQRSVAV